MAAEVEALVREIQDLHDTNDKLRKKMGWMEESSRREIGTLKQVIEADEAKIDALRAELSKVQERLECKEEEFRALKHEYDAARACCDNQQVNPALDPPVGALDPESAEDFLKAAAAEMADRAASRDSPDGERSMAATVEAFWTIYGKAIMARGWMTETEGWQFASVLKKVRGAQGEYRQDDYTDDVSYAALAAEAACTEVKR